VAQRIQQQPYSLKADLQVVGVKVDEAKEILNGKRQMVVAAAALINRVWRGYKGKKARRVIL